MLRPLLQEFLLSWVSFSIINAAHTSTVLMHTVGVFAQQNEKTWLVARARSTAYRPALAGHQSI